nr:immunoglobulin heavy chain junction region [Mus musculus]
CARTNWYAMDYW